MGKEHIEADLCLGYSRVPRAGHFGGDCQVLVVEIKVLFMLTHLAAHDSDSVVGASHVLVVAAKCGLWY